MQSSAESEGTDGRPTGDVDDRGERPAEPLSIPIDLEDRDFEYVVRLGLPGYRREEVTVAVEDALVRITADPRESCDPLAETFTRRERARRAVRQTVGFPENVTPNGTWVTLEDGVLTVTVPKAEPGTDE